LRAEEEAAERQASERIGSHYGVKPRGARYREKAAGAFSRGAAALDPGQPEARPGGVDIWRLAGPKRHRTPLRAPAEVISHRHSSSTRMPARCQICLFRHEIEN
jgi:hypothetical protein